MDFLGTFRYDYDLSQLVANNAYRNMTELCFAIIAVIRGESLVAQTALTGSIISSCLVIFGTCLLVRGITQVKEQQSYPIIIARTNAQLLVVSLVSIALPTAFKTWSQDSGSSILYISRGASIILLLEYMSYIWFSYHTHTQLGERELPNMQTGLIAASLAPVAIANPKELILDLKQLRASAQEARRTPRYPIYVDVIIMTISLTAMILASIYVIEAIEAPSRALGLSKSFVGLVVMPSIIASFEHIMAVVHSRNQNQEIAWIIELALGSSIRISLFVFPITVLVGWALGIPDMNMILDGFQVTILCLTILIVNYVMTNRDIQW
jgi:Ca2+:H+ antiporter